MPFTTRQVLLEVLVRPPLSIYAISALKERNACSGWGVRSCRRCEKNSLGRLFWHSTRSTLNIPASLTILRKFSFSLIRIFFNFFQPPFDLNSCSGQPFLFAFWHICIIGLWRFAFELHPPQIYLDETSFCLPPKVSPTIHLSPDFSVKHQTTLPIISIQKARQ